MRLVFRPEVAADLAEAADWYEGRRDGLGEDFRRAVDITFDWIEESPRLFPVVRGDVRRALVRRFPYGVFFHIRGDTAVVLAVSHGKRAPRHWRRRR